MGRIESMIEPDEKNCVFENRLDEATINSN